MIGIDTNVLVRFLVQDDPDQSTRAARAFEHLTASDPGYLTTVVLAETYWVLTHAYKFSVAEVLTTLADVIATEQVAVQDVATATAAVESARAGADFADALISSACAERGCRTVLSFDGRAQKSLGFTEPK